MSANEIGFRTVSLRPPAIWGPGDPYSRGLPGAIRTGRFAFVDRGDYAFATCHVDNVVEAVECSLERGEGGRAFFICDRDRQTFREFVASIAALKGLSIEKLGSMPYWRASAIGRALDAVWAVTGREGDPPISRSMMRMIGREFSLNDAAARRELGYVGMVGREPRRVCRRLQLLRKWRPHEKENKQIFTGSPRPSSADGFGSPRRIFLAMVSRSPPRSVARRRRSMNG